MTEMPCEQPFEDGTHCQEPRDHQLSAIARQHLEQCRAELAATRARLCGHGVERTRAKCADCDKPETEAEATEETK